VVPGEFKKLVCTASNDTDKILQFLVALFASIGSVLYGYDLGVIAGAIAAKSFDNEFHPTSAEQGAVVSVFTGGAFFGAMFAGFVGDWLGRKKTILMGSAIFCLGGTDDSCLSVKKD